MTTPTPDGPPSGGPGSPEPVSPEPVSLDKAAEAAPPPVEPSFDPYRFGAPEHPVPPEYAPPGYVPPAPSGPPVPPPYGPYPPYGPPGAGFPGYSPTGYPPPGYAGGPAGPFPPPPYHSYPRPRTGNGKAIAALVLGIAAIPLSIFAFLDLFVIIPAIVFGSLGLADARRGAGGLGLARAGLICTAVGTIAAIALTVFIVHRVSSCDDQFSSGSHQYNVCVRKGL